MQQCHFSPTLSLRLRGTQNLSVKAKNDAVISWLYGKVLPLGCGAALCVYHGDCRDS